MSDSLYEAFRIYLSEGLLGIEEEQVLEFLNNKGYVEGSEKREQAIDAYMKVTRDPILKTLIPELPSYDLNHTGTDIKTLYGIKKREMEQGQVEPKKSEEKDSTMSMIEDTKRYNASFEESEVKEQSLNSVLPQANQTSQKIEINEASVQENEVITPDHIAEQQPDVFKARGNKRTLEKKLNQVGYANVVLMSIIVIIIVAIICVFIFM